MSSNLNHPFHNSLSSHLFLSISFPSPSLSVLCLTLFHLLFTSRLPSSSHPSPGTAKMTATTIQWEERTPSEASAPPHLACTEAVLGRERRINQRKKGYEEEERKRGLQREGEAGVRGGGETTYNKRWMEAARTGATERSSPTEKKNSRRSNSERKRRWRQKAETCPQVIHTHTHTLAHTDEYVHVALHMQTANNQMHMCMHARHGCVCVFASCLRCASKHANKDWQTEHRKPPLITQTHSD